MRRRGSDSQGSRAAAAVCRLPPPLLLLALVATFQAAAAAAAGASSLGRPPLRGAGDQGHGIEAILEEAIPFATAQLAATAALDLPAGVFPNGTDWTHATGAWMTTGPERWTAGLLCGCYWKAYALTRDPSWAELAAAQLEGLRVYSYEGKLTHDFMASFGEALDADVAGAPREEYESAMVAAAEVLADRYSKKVGAVRIWGTKEHTEEFKVIVDSMATLHLLVLASRLPGGRPEWADMALNHARTVTRDHFRPDGSTFHLAVYDPRTGGLLSQGTHQGYSDDSTWSRGQAWAVVGFTHMARLTGDLAMLATAQRAADYFLLRLAEADDGVPLWDFDVPPKAEQPWKDSSAAAIAASGLLRLGPLSGNASYTRAGVAIVQALTQRYLASTAPGPPLASILRNGTWTAPAGNSATGLIYGDFYYLDALALLQQGVQGVQRVPTPTPAPEPAAAPVAAPAPAA